MSTFTKKNQMNTPEEIIDKNDERRSREGCRRSGKDRRRANYERRCDVRDGQKPRKNLYAWFRSLTNPRLGVDRRKNGDQRVLADRRQRTPRSLLTQEELNDLFS